jgi:hypothetical protein
MDGPWFLGAFDSERPVVAGARASSIHCTNALGVELSEPSTSEWPDLLAYENLLEGLDDPSISDSSGLSGICD